MDTGIPPRFFFLIIFMVWGLRLLALYRCSAAVRPAEALEVCLGQPPHWLFSQQ